MIELLIIYGIWIAFACLSGYGEAYYFSAVSHKVINRLKYDHKLFTVLRGIVAVALLYFTLGITWGTVIIGLSLVCAFSFWHDGVYYSTRDNLDNCYPLRWRAHSLTSDAFFDLNYNIRSVLFFFGSTVLTITYHYL
jgi:hypothetical protein